MGVAVTTDGDCGPRPLYKGRLTKGTDLGRTSLLGGRRRQAQKGRKALPATSEEGLIPATAVHCHGVPCTGLHFRKQEALERWYRLIKQSVTYHWVAVSERKVGGLSVGLLCPLGPPALGKAVVPPDTLPP